MLGSSHCPYTEKKRKKEHQKQSKTKQNKTLGIIWNLKPLIGS